MAIRRGKYLAGWSVVDGFDACVRERVFNGSAGTCQLPVRAVVGIWLIGDDEFSLFDRTPAGRNWGTREGRRPEPSRH